MTFGDLDLKFSEKLRNSCPNSYVKKNGGANLRGGGFKLTPTPTPSWARVKFRGDIFTIVLSQDRESPLLRLIAWCHP